MSQSTGLPVFGEETLTGAKLLAKPPLETLHFHDHAESNALNKIALLYSHSSECNEAPTIGYSH